MQKDVKIIGFKVSNFGIFKALEFDFEQFKSGVIAIKGKSGEGKSTFQRPEFEPCLALSTRAQT